MAGLWGCCGVFLPGSGAAVSSVSSPVPIAAQPTPQESSAPGGRLSGVARSDGQPLLPFKRGGQKKEEHSVDGGTGGDPGDKAEAATKSFTRSKSVQLMRSWTMKSDAEGTSSSLERPKAVARRDSQFNFANPDQTVVVFDWDDTLFPTTYVQDDLHLDWQVPLHRQRIPTAAKEKIATCEMRAGELLEKAYSLSHVVVVTLASNGWVDLACEQIFPRVGNKLREMEIPVIYAQDAVGEIQTTYDKAQFQSSADVERYWGLVKGHAIAKAVGRFYSQYEGQSWKNILSVGDSNFERYGLLAATSAYMQERGMAIEGVAVWGPTQEGCWSTETGGHIKKLRAKCCKLVDSPDCDELNVELEMLKKWLEAMVALDAGFDLDLEALETEEQVRTIEAVLRGEVPPTMLPRSHARGGALSQG
mmetsp:Transcript_72406/g.162652  ORF Transcript_72406/g.162652 Transcript_72406/m.162652 type:complete len:418 (+) Transcript_72406:68-1321(+)